LDSPGELSDNLHYNSPYTFFATEPKRTRRKIIFFPVTQP
jgi:hypothetical protein